MKEFALRPRNRNLKILVFSFRILSLATQPVKIIDPAFIWISWKTHYFVWILWYSKFSWKILKFSILWLSWLLAIWKLQKQKLVNSWNSSYAWLYVTKYCIRKPVDTVLLQTSFFFATRVFRRLIDADLTIHWTKNGFFWRIKKRRWHLLVELSYLFFEKARIKGHSLLFWIIHDFNHSKLTKIRAESTNIDHVGRVWRTLSRVF